MVIFTHLPQRNSEPVSFKISQFQACWFVGVISQLHTFQFFTQFCQFCWINFKDTHHLASHGSAVLRTSIGYKIWLHPKQNNHKP